MDFQIAASRLRKADSFTLRLHIASSHGLSYLGGGCFGSAYLHKKTGRVLKISHTKQDGTMGFIGKCAEFLQKHKRAPKYCPEVYEFGVQREFWYAVMEYVPECGDWALGVSKAEVKEAIVRTVGGMHKILDLDSWDNGSYAPARGSVHDLRWDLHEGNYGMVGSRLVVFDPFGNGTHIKTFPKAVRAKVQHGPSRGRWA